MDDKHNPPPCPVGSTPFWRSRYGLGLLVFGAIAAYFLLTEHRAHVFGALPYLLILACPLMHVFMHRGHGRDGGAHAGHQGSHKSPDSAAAPPASGTGEQP